ncbi:MAG: DUF4296 domain-containing protein [Weeksellaceae bacterium]|nr:DUF4296 domain-containing protein [Weeksellaceae bacterium]
MRYAITLGFLLFLCACFNAIDKPADLISRNHMKSIVVDIYYQRALKSTRSYSDTLSFEELNRAILQKHGVTLDQFERSMKYYVIDDSAYDVFLGEIQDSLKTLIPESQMPSLETGAPIPNINPSTTLP